MNVDITIIVFLFGGIVLGALLGYFARQTIAKGQLKTAEGKTAKIFEEAKTKAQEAILAAKNKAVEILEEAKRKERAREDNIINLEKRLENREVILDKKMDELDRGGKILEQKAEEIRKIRKDVEETKREELRRLERVAGLSKADAKKVLLELTEEENREWLAEKIKKMQTEGQEKVEFEAKELITRAVQKYAGSHSAEITTTTVSIPSDEIKGRIIGREGRNIKALEKLTGVEVIVDDTPEAIVISGFDPMRREIARLALEKLVEDGRIHPARIEEAVEYAKAEVLKKIREAGEAAAFDTGVVGLEPKLIELLGRLRYRTSYGQNVLIHSLEVAHLSGALAAELGADVQMAKRAGLLHDIGKAIDHEIQGTHVELGIKILEKFNVEPRVINAIKSHHEDYPFESKESFIIAAADAISASRPGARKDTLDDYLKRLGELENIALSFPGVEKCFAIQAGREVRVFVRPDEIDDLGALKMAKDIAKKVEEELKYPGEIKVNVLRETRSVEYAR